MFSRLVWRRALGQIVFFCTLIEFRTAGTPPKIQDDVFATEIWGLFSWAFSCFSVVVLVGIFVGRFSWGVFRGAFSLAVLVGVFVGVGVGRLRSRFRGVFSRGVFA